MPDRIAAKNPRQLPGVFVSNPQAAEPGVVLSSGGGIQTATFRVMSSLAAMSGGDCRCRKAPSTRLFADSSCQAVLVDNSLCCPIRQKIRSVSPHSGRIPVRRINAVARLTES